VRRKAWRTFCALEVIGVEVGIKDAASEQPIDGDEDGDSNGDDDLGRAASCCEPGEEGIKVTAFFAARRPGELDTQVLKRRLPLATFQRKKPSSDDRATNLGARTRRQVAADKL
jgi:hypothetical protein